MIKVKTLQELADELNILVEQGHGQLKVALYDSQQGYDEILQQGVAVKVASTGDTELPMTVVPEDQFVSIEFDSSWRHHVE